MKQKIILQVIGGLNRNGAETMLMNIYRKIDRNYKFVFVTYNLNEAEHDYEQEVISRGDQIIKLNLKRVSNPITFYADLRKIMKERKYDCVHCHTLFNSGVVMLAAKHMNIPVRITHSHSSGITKRDNFVTRTYFKFSRYLIKTYSNVQIACNIDSGYYLFGNDFHGFVLNNGIDVSKFNPNTFPMYSIHEDLKRNDILKLAAISSFYPVKNHKYMIEIAKKLKERNVDFRLFFVGRGHLEEMLREKVKEYQLEDYVIFLGVLNNVYEFLPAIDLVLMPSLYEGIPVSLIESQSSGVPAIISNHISNDVDLGLGLIEFLDIEENYLEEWVEKICSFKKSSIDTVFIGERIKEKGYNVESNIQFISNIYDGNI